MRIFITLTFLGLTAWFLFGASRPRVPVAPAAAISAADISTAPLRRLPDDPTLIDIGGVQLNCSDCHRLFKSSPDKRQAMAHQHVVLDHGMNDRCLNCHSIADRLKFELHGGEQIAFDEVPLLCAKCHGPTYRDWQSGIHGRTGGYWDTTRGQSDRLICTQCHDPHAPAIGDITPLPGPNTLRMGEQRQHRSSPSGPRTSPLRSRTGGEAAQEPDDDQH